jgi:2-C-methyl-D-erythritol 4-phosphate cytidylyltransferase
MPLRAMVVVGGGSSTRFGVDKLMVGVGDRPLIAHTIDAVVTRVDVCVVVCRPGVAGELAAIRDDVMVTEGGETRTQSEMAGLAVVGENVDLIGIHDAARPLVKPEMIDRLFTVAELSGGAVPLVSYDRLIIDRKTHRPVPGVLGAQTPQVFRGPELKLAYGLAAEASFDGHDTVEVMQRFSDVKIVGVPGDPHNLKVTYPGDLDRVREARSGPSRI